MVLYGITLVSLAEELRAVDPVLYPHFTRMMRHSTVWHNEAHNS